MSKVKRLEEIFKSELEMYPQSTGNQLKAIRSLVRKSIENGMGFPFSISKKEQKIIGEFRKRGLL